MQEDCTHYARGLNTLCKRSTQSMQEECILYDIVHTVYKGVVHTVRNGSSHSMKKKCTQYARGVHTVYKRSAHYERGVHTV